MNGDLRVAYRASGEGERDIVFVPNWFTCCEILPELPRSKGGSRRWLRLGGSSSLTSRARERPIPSRRVRCRHWSNGQTASPRCSTISAVTKQFSSQRGAVATAALFAATHPSRTTALVVLEGYADPPARAPTDLTPRSLLAKFPEPWRTGEFEHASNPDMPWNEEIRHRVGTAGPHGSESGNPRARVALDV